VDERSAQWVRYRRERARPIAAPPEAVWPWLVQMGFDRGGWYAVDRLEKLFGVGRFATGGSARRVEPALQGLTVGDRMPLSRTRWLDVVVLDAPRELVLVLPPGRLEWTWRFTLEPIGERASVLAITTELALEVHGRAARAAARAGFALFDVGHGLMEAVQFRTLARRVPGCVPGAERGRADG
jgi:hypothetical protein